MKYLLPFYSIALALILANSTHGQSTKLTLTDAVNYGLKNHTEIQNKILGETYAKAQLIETRSIGIPQISANLQFIDNIEKQVFVFPVNGNPTPIRVGNTFVSTGTIQATWLAFDATYFLGLKAAAAFTELAKIQTNLTKRDVCINVTKAYHLVLITKENVGLLTQNIKTIESILYQTEGYYKNGFVEKVDVDRLRLSLSNLNAQLDALSDQVQVTEKLLKFTMGMPIDADIELTDNLESLYTTEIEHNDLKADAKQRIEFQLLQNQLTLAQLDKKRFEISKYPNLVLFGNYQQNNFGDKLDYSTWYGNSFWGLKIGIPIFSGFNNKAQLIKRNVTIDQTLNNIAMFENSVNLEASVALTKYHRSLKAIENQKKNLILANEIIAITNSKLKEGVGSNLEIANAQQELKTSQTNYLNSIYDLLNAQIELKKAYGKF